jgi:hypothetical protein
VPFSGPAAKAGASVGGRSAGLFGTVVGALLGETLDAGIANRDAQPQDDWVFSVDMGGQDAPADSEQKLPELDSTGKVHGAIPNHVPEGATPQELKELKTDLKKSIETRKNEQERLGEDGPHRERIRQEERLLRQVEKKLSGS